MYKFNGYQDYIENELENALLTAKAKVLIIDNISCLSYHTNVSTGAATLMNTMRKIIIKYQISILLLAHTPKRNPVSLITQHDLQGSKMLINFCDSAFAIGESRQTPGMRYLKQIKQRSTQQTYGADNVCLCTIKKQDNFLQFQFTAHANEADHLQQKNTMERELVKAKVMELSREGMSIRKIAGELGLSASAVNRMTKQPNS
jgi:hypothetical protein